MISLHILIPAIIYYISCYIVWRWTKLSYSSEGVYRNSKPNRNDLLLNFLPIVNSVMAITYLIISWKHKDNREPFNLLNIYKDDNKLDVKFNENEAIISEFNFNIDKFKLGIKKYGYDSDFRREYESLTQSLRHEELKDLFKKYEI